MVTALRYTGMIQHKPLKANIQCHLVPWANERATTMTAILILTFWDLVESGITPSGG